MEAFDICILSTKQDEAISHRLGESIRAYRLPSNVALPDPSLDYRRIVYDCSGEPMDNAARDILDRSRFLVLSRTAALWYH